MFGTKHAVEEIFFISNPGHIPELNANIRMEVGIENLVHLEYELFQSKYHLKDCVLGKIYFVEVKMKVKMIELQIVKKETIGQGERFNFYLLYLFYLLIR